MARIDEIVSEQFHRWEMRGRGWQVHPYPVIPEPAFAPFDGYAIPQVEDDGRRPTYLSKLVESIQKRISGDVPQGLPPPADEEPEPIPFERTALVELQSSLPAKLDISRESFAGFCRELAACIEPVSFELVGTAEKIVTQFAVHPNDTPLLGRQLSAYFPEAVFLPRENTLLDAWCESDGEAGIVEFGLECELMLPLATGAKLDPFVGLIATMSELDAGEVALFQVLFDLAHEDWCANSWRAIARTDGRALFTDHAHLATGTKEKFSSQLYGAVVRIAAKAPDYDRASAILRSLAFALRVFSRFNGNALVPLKNEGYPFDAHEEDIFLRQSRRSGMIVNLDELMGFVHFPSSEVRSAKLVRAMERTKAAPALVTSAPGLHGLRLGENRHLGKSASVSLTLDQRSRHMHVIGVSGTGKSTLLYNMISQDIVNGEGLAVLDPHGDLIDRILGSVPPGRVSDVILVDPSDEEYSIGFNILSAHSDLERNLLSSDLVSVFQRLSTSWGDQLGSVLQNAILAFLESDEGGTLTDLRRFLIEPGFRERFLKSVRDPDIVYYWKKAFVLLSGNKSVGPVLTRLDGFLSAKTIRHMVSQKENRLDFGQILDTGKIFLARLPHGLMGSKNASLLGSLFVAKFQQLAMGRQSQSAESRRPFWLYIDEFQHFITPSMTEILTGTRKYGLGLVLAHHELHQLSQDRNVASAVLAHPFARVVFRVGDADARALEDGFSSFEARDLQNLEKGRAIVRVGKADGDFNLTVPLPPESDPVAVATTKAAVIAASRARYAKPRAEVEADLAKSRSIEDDEPMKKAPRVTAKQPSPESRPPADISTDEHSPTSSQKENPAVVSPTTLPPASQPSLEPVFTAGSNPPPSSGRPRDVLREMGRGGAQHKAIQERLKKAAESCGFLASIEKSILENAGSIDLFLERSDVTIACEISITTTVDHEVGNVTKCLKAGMPRIAVISLDAVRLEKLSAAVNGSLGREAASRVSFFLPDDFIAYLTGLPRVVPSPIEVSDPPGDRIKVRRGYRVKRVLPKLTDEERRRREEETNRSISDVMRNNPS